MPFSSNRCVRESPIVQDALCAGRERRAVGKQWAVKAVDKGMWANAGVCSTASSRVQLAAGKTLSHKHRHVETTESSTVNSMDCRM